MAMENGSMSAKKITLMIVTVVVLGGVAVVSILRDRIVNVQQWTVSITGEGRVTYVSDLADITLGVQVDKAPTAENALAQLNKKISSTIESITQTGVPAADVQTQNYSLYPQYDYKNNSQTLSGYSANQQLRVRVRGVDQSTDMIGKVIAAAAKQGVNQVLGVEFSISNLKEIKEQARIAAIADAKSKAQELAQAAGVKLGDIVGWWENPVQVPGPKPYYGEVGGMGGGGGVQSTSGTLPNGGQELVLEISMNYRIK